MDNIHMNVIDERQGVVNVRVMLQDLYIIKAKYYELSGHFDESIELLNQGKLNKIMIIFVAFFHVKIV